MMNELNNDDAKSILSFNSVSSEEGGGVEPSYAAPDTYEDFFYDDGGPTLRPAVCWNELLLS